MKLRKKLFSLLTVSLPLVLSAQGSPEFTKLPSMFDMLSDNGEWAISQKGSEVDGSLAPSGGVIYNLATKAQTDISHSSGLSGVADITDDGSIVVGECQGKPAYWSKSTGEWTLLPTPDGYRAGRLNSVTPDGHFAVGYVIPPDFSWGAYPVAYDLTKGELLSTEGIPTLDMTNLDQRQNCFYSISSDGRYILGSLSVSYILPASLCSYLYDIQEHTYKMIGFTENHKGAWQPKWDNLYFVDSPQMSHNGKFVTGCAYIVENNGTEFGTEYSSTFKYDVEEDEFTVYNKEGENDVVGFQILNDGAIYAVSPASNPYASMLVRSGNYFVDLNNIFTQVYGIDFKAMTNYTNTGKPISVSEDGLTVLMLPNPDETYLLRLPEPLSEAAAKVDLLANYTSTPASGTIMSTVNNISLSFDRQIETNCSYSRIKLTSDDGQDSWTPLQNNGYTASGNVVSLAFRQRELRAGVGYTLTLPAGAVRIKGDHDVTSKEIKIKFIGRENAPVKMTDVYPADGASVSSLDVNTNPMVMSFDATVSVAQGALAYLYRVGEEQPYATLNIASGANQIVLYPVSAQYLFNGTDYKVVVPAGTVSDVSGAGANEEITITYHGSYVREVSADDKYLFNSDCSNANDFILYDGDHKKPSGIPASWGFTADVPWYFVRSSTETFDMAMAAHSMYTDGGTADDWMAVPQLFIPDKDCYLTFQAQSYLMDKTDRLKVYVYCSSNVYNTFTKDIVSDIRANGTLVFDEVLSPGASEEDLEDDWQDYNVPLEQFAGKDVYIAFLNDNTDQSAVFVDNIRVIRDLKFLSTFRHSSRVVNKEEQIISGDITVASEVDTYSTVKLVLKDGEGNIVDEISESGLALKKNDVYEYAFETPLKLTVGEIHPFSVEISLDNESTVISGEIRDLAFEPKKKIVIEEYSGMTCSNCPLGFRALENIESLYPEKLIPVCLRAFGGDQLGAGIGGYVDFLGMSAAPAARINRGEISFPMVSNDGDYMFSGNGLKDSETGADILTWLDIFRNELSQPADFDIDIESAYDESSKTVNAVCTVRNALNFENTSINVFAVILENNLTTAQQNGFSGVEDPDLGEWGKGGAYGSMGSMVYPFVINDVARGYYGTTCNGTGGLIPSKMTAGEKYDVKLALPMPASVSNAANCELVVMLIDPGKGNVINANRVAINGSTTGIDKNGVSEAAEISVAVVGGSVVVAAGDKANVCVYAPDGRLIASAAGNGTVVANVGGYKGAVIVNAATSSATVVRKAVVR